MKHPPKPTVAVAVEIMLRLSLRLQDLTRLKIDEELGIAQIGGQRGGGFPKISAEHFGCSTVRNRGNTQCTNRLTLRHVVDFH